MAPRKPARKLSSPLPPEPPSDPRVVEHSAISSDDEWEDERVLDTDLAGQVADRVRLTRCELQRVILTGAQLRGLVLTDVLAVDCELSGAFLHEAVLRRVELRNCRMTGIVLSQSSMSHVRLTDCKLDDANLRLLHADQLVMNDCSVVEGDLYESVITQSVLAGCDLRGCDFSRASVPELHLGRSNLDGVRGALSLRGVVIEGDQVLPLALGMLGDLGIEIRNDER
jgi:uncharacterized protein YjbI with pentapeptide repeats